VEQRLRTLDEAECYTRCYGWAGGDESVRVLRKEPDPREEPSVAGDRLRRLLELRLDARDPSVPYEPEPAIESAA
jgi:hypothetical protein